MSEEAVSGSKEKLFEKLTPFLLVSTIVLAFGVGVLWQKVSNLEKGKTQGTATANPVAQKATPAPVSLETIRGFLGKDLVKFGDENRKIIFVEISDPSCPFCGIASGKNPELNKQVGSRFILTADGGTYVAPVPEIKKLVDQEKAAFVYIYTPGHGNGEMGAKALYCAFEKGKFWPVHDLLMNAKGYDLLNNQIRNDKQKAGELAAFLKNAINSDQMKACLESGKYDARLASDTALAASLGVSVTPYFIVNTTRFEGAYNYKDMEAVVSSALGQ